MPAYKAPLRDMRYALDLMGYDDLTKLPGYEDFDRDTVDAVLEEAAKLCEEVLAPLNRSGDEEGCHYENGVVRTPKGFGDAYTLFRDGGWTSLACAPQYGGQGMPVSINALVEEMICASNMSFGMYPGLSHGAYKALHAFGSKELQDAYLPKLVDGTWSGTMCMTEPHCGTDLGQMRTRAVPQDDGSYRLTGTKIFISAGEHDLTENIIHLVLAKIPGGPKGTKGISLFLVPKFLPNANGDPGERNSVRCGSIEHKMGIKASSTCVMNFDDAKGFLVGEEHKGMKAMFTMMNTARLGVGVQGLGLAEAAYQGAVAYARDRLQGRALSGVKMPEKAADPIIVHPDVRRMLLTQRAYIEGCRALAMWTAKAIDTYRMHPDPVERTRADDFVAVITPVIKAFFTDMGFEATNIGVQVFGGHGYIRENGMEQLVRDARIAQIYEGANGIQGLDLIGRKMAAHAGRYMRTVFHPISEFVEANKANAELADFVGPLGKAFGRLQQGTMHVARSALARRDEAGAAATDYLRLFGLTVLAFMWARMAQASLPHADSDPFHKAKVMTARFYMERLLPQTSALLASITAGCKTMMAFEEAAF
jgi:butyryl-CoA dehydrogenase